MYLLVKLLRKHKHKFTFDKQVRACNSGYIHSSNMDNSLETRIVSATCGTTCGAMGASAQWKKKEKEEVHADDTIYIIAYSSFIRVHPCFLRTMLSSIEIGMCILGQVVRAKLKRIQHILPHERK